MCSSLVPKPLADSQNDLKIAGDKVVFSVDSVFDPNSSSVIDVGAKVSVAFCTSGSEKVMDSPGKTSRIGSEKIGQH